jgi:predicted amidohydrolase YtcJ
MKSHCIAALAVMAMAAAGCAPARQADVVLYNGVVHTMDGNGGARATAVAVAGGSIAYVGSDDGARALAGPATEMVDLAGKTVVPGFIESHGHLLGLGHLRRQLELSGTRTYDELIAMVAEAVKKAKPGEWIQGRGWHQSKWEPRPVRLVKGFPLHDALSAVSPDNPVWLRHASGHAGIANARAMQVVGIGPGTRSPEGGEVIRDRDGRATGVFVELAQQLIGDAIPSPSKEEEQLALETATAECLSKGVTTFADAGAARKQIAIYRENAAAGKLRMRIAAMIGGRDGLDTAEYFSEPPDTGAPGGFLTARALKLAIDGALGSRSAWMLEPYDDDTTSTGFETLKPADLERVASEALRRGYQVCVHAIGDRANRETLDAFERAFRGQPGAAKRARFRIEHAQILDSADIPRFARLGVIAAMQGIHCTSDRPWAPERIGMARIAEGAYAWRKLLDSGALIVNGTDTPVEDVDPLKCFYASVTRRQSDGTPPGGFDPDQKMTREEALRSYTIDGAYGIFREGELGSLREGKLADLVVLSGDILSLPEDQLLSVRVAATMVNGRFVFRAR